jgi:hypothetical protein
MPRGETESIHRRISVRMWGDAKVRALSRPPPNAETLCIHLLAGEQTGIVPGLFKIGEAAFAEQLGWDLKGFREAFAEVSAQGLVKADWKARVVFVPNAIKHNQPANPNVVTHWRTAWELLPECELKTEAREVLRDFLKGIKNGEAKAFAEAFDIACPKATGIQEAGSRKQEAVKETKDLSAAPTAPVQPTLLLEPDKATARSGVSRVFDHWRSVMAHPRAVLDKKRTGLIRVQLEHYTAEQLCRAIDGYRLDSFTMGENDRGTKYDGIGTIFRDADHVEKGLAFSDNPPRASAPLRAVVGGRPPSRGQNLEERFSEFQDGQTFGGGKPEDPK